MLSSLHPLWPWLRLLNCACACSTMLKERSKRLQLRFNIPNISEDKKCWMNVEAKVKRFLKLFQHRFNIRSTGFDMFKSVERAWQTLSTFPLNKMERCWSKCWSRFLGNSATISGRLGGTFTLLQNIFLKNSSILRMHNQLLYWQSPSKSSMYLHLAHLTYMTSISITINSAVITL